MLKGKTVSNVVKFLDDKGFKSVAKDLRGRKIIDWAMLSQFINSKTKELKAEDWSRLSQIVEKSELS